MSASPILVFPWQRPFLPDLKAFLTSIGKGRAGATLLIVPHNRPWRYLTKLYAEEGYQGLLPKVMTLADVISAWRSQTSADPLHTANVLDRVALLHECVMGLAQDDEGLAALLAVALVDEYGGEISAATVSIKATTAARCAAATNE